MAIDVRKIREFEFHNNCFGNLEQCVSFELKDGVARLTRRRGLGGVAELPADARVLEAIARALEACGVAGWQEEYRPEACVLDGSSWNLRIVYEDGAEFVSGGSNAWPEGYDELGDGLLALFEEAGE